MQRPLTLFRQIRFQTETGILIRLEAVKDAHIEFVASRRSGTGRGLDLFRRVASHCVEGSPLGKRIVIADSSRPAVEVGVVLVIHIAIVHSNLGGTAEDRIVSANADTPAVNIPVALAASDGVQTRITNASTGAGGQFLIMEVLSESNDLEAVIEAIVATESHGVALIGDVRAGTVRAVHRGISNENAFQAAILITGSERSVTVRRALAFSAGVGSRIHLERIHGITGQAGVGRRAVRNRVIGAGPHRSGRSAGTKSRGVVSEERINSAEEAIGTEHAAEDRQAAKRQSTEAAGNADGSFTAEKAAILLGIRETRVRFKTRLENEAHLVAVAEVLSTPQAPAGTEFLTVLHGKRVGVRNTSHVRVRVDIAETRIDQAIELNIGSRGSSDHTGGNA